MKKREFFLLTLVILGAFAVRLYRFNGPVADWHSWRQSDTAAVSRNFLKFGFDVLHPRFDDLSNGVSLLDNPQGYRFVEFPFYNVLQAGLFRLFDRFTIEQWGRLVTNISAVIGIIFLYLLVRLHVSWQAAIFAALFYAVVPYNVYYGRVILPDQLMTSMMLGSIYFFDVWIEKKYKLLLTLSAVFFATALLIKPYVLFFGLSIFYLIYRKYGLDFVKKKELWFFLILSFLPFFLWRWWMQHYPEGIPRNDWLYNGNEIRFKIAFFWWIFAERIAKIMLGYWGLPIVILGILGKVKEKEGFFFLTFIISSLAYLTVFATGNVQHEYYQILIVPTLAIFFGKGVDVFLSLSQKEFSRTIGIAALGGCFGFMLIFSWREIRAYYNINHPEIIEAGRAIDKLTPKDAKIIAIYNGDTTFLYHTNRQGWPVWERPLYEFIKAGAGYITFVNPTKDELGFGKHYTTLARTEKYVIFDLTRPLYFPPLHEVEASQSAK
ncbi:MAG: glycosyltransferase family 39 protein [Candidatus Levybacteria bacterium]|nr:glycosyltransferase family 39 protein [Candidatus Levybacteria bacterium]